MARIIQGGTVTVEFTKEEFDALLYVAGNVGLDDLSAILQVDEDDPEKRGHICNIFIDICSLSE